MPRESSPGFVRTTFVFAATDAAEFTGTGAVTLIDTFKPGFRCFLEKLQFRTQTIAATAGSQVYRLRKGGAAGTIVLSATLDLSLTDTKGEVAEYNVSAANDVNSYLGDTDGFSLTRDAAGTAFGTAPTGTWHITVRQRPQAKR